MKGTKGSVSYVRVDEIDGIELVPGNKIDGDKPRPLIYGSVVVDDGDSDGDDIVHHRLSVDAVSTGLGECISLTGHSRPIDADNWFYICVNLWVKWWDRDGREITKEIACGQFAWDPMIDGGLIAKPLRRKVRGKDGSVTVGFTVIGDALSATINVAMMNELPAQIYGTISAVRHSQASLESTLSVLVTKLTLFKKSARKSVQVNPRQSIPLGPKAIIPVQVDSNFTIAVDLWNHANDEQIAVGSLQFTPLIGTQTLTVTGKLGEVQVSFTCK